MNTDYDNMGEELECLERQFKTACQQIVQLNRRLDDMSLRYERANREGRRTFRYSLRLRIAVIEGTRNMYYDYAASKADQITDLRALMRMGDTLANHNSSTSENVSSLELAEVMSDVEHSDFDDDADDSDLDSEVEMMSDDQADIAALYEDSDDPSPAPHPYTHQCC